MSAYRGSVSVLCTGLAYKYTIANNEIRVYQFLGAKGTQARPKRQDRFEGRRSPRKFLSPRLSFSPQKDVWSHCWKMIFLNTFRFNFLPTSTNRLPDFSFVPFYKNVFVAQFEYGPNDRRHRHSCGMCLLLWRKSYLEWTKIGNREKRGPYFPENGFALVLGERNKFIIYFYELLSGDFSNWPPVILPWKNFSCFLVCYHIRQQIWSNLVGAQILT